MSWLSTLIAHYGYWTVAAAIGLESMGIPVPGETALVTAAVYAGATHNLNIAMVILAAIAGAIVGDNVGFLVGRQFGYRLLLRHGSLFRLTTARIKLGQFLFLRHGGKMVFFGRFIAVLRALAALLAGVNCMAWRRFLIFNAAGGIVWAGGYGMLAYLLGERVERFTRPVAIAAAAGAVFAGMAFVWFVRAHEAQLEAEAEKALPGPLQ
jgi:membrane protein DedA with SNARE-associated domain